jgi:hypothetical protein
MALPVWVAKRTGSTIEHAMRDLLELVLSLRVFSKALVWLDVQAMIV